MTAVSVLMGAFNNAATLREAMDSILAQTVADLELIVIDDGSTDDSRAVAEGVDDPRVRVLAMPRNVGIARSLNAGLEAARAPVIAVQDADDFSAPERMERQLAFLASRLDVAVVGTRMREIDATGALVTPRTLFRAGDVRGVLLRFNPIPNTSAAFRRDVALGLGGYDPRYRYAMEYDLWLRVADDHGVWALDEPLSTRRMTTTNVAARAQRAQTAEAIRIVTSTLRRRRTLRGARGLAIPIAAYLEPDALKRRRRRRLGQAS
ncbi:MAG: glycosyltransferase [Solirubrobacteraceae bacterium]